MVKKKTELILGRIPVIISTVTKYIMTSVQHPLQKSEKKSLLVESVISNNESQTGEYVVYE